MSTEWKRPDVDELLSFPRTPEKLSKLEDELLDALLALERLNRVDPHPILYAKLVKQFHNLLKQTRALMDAMRKANA